MATPRQLDAVAAKHLHEAKLLLQRGFAEGLGNVRDFPDTVSAYKELGEVLDKEEAIETSVAIREKVMEQQAQPRQHRPGGKNVCVMVDGSYNSIVALRWSIENVVGSGDDLYLVTVTPWEDYTADASRILQECYDYAHNAGIKPSHLHVKTLVAQGSSRTAGVGESIVQFVEVHKVDLVVLGSRGMGSIKRNLMSLVGMGSVSDFCVTHLKCPIMVMKEQEDGSMQAEQVSPRPAAGEGAEVGRKDDMV